MGSRRIYRSVSPYQKNTRNVETAKTVPIVYSEYSDIDMSDLDPKNVYYNWDIFERIAKSKMNGPVMGIQSQQPVPGQQQPQQPLQPIDNISKIKSLIGPLRESLSSTMKTASQVLQQNCQIDNGSLKGVDGQIPRFDKNIEEFFSLCDQVELHLKTSIKAISQSESSSRYLPMPVNPTRTENLGLTDNTLTYPQYLSTVNAQVLYSKEIHNTLVQAAQNISD